jgi:uncharacterized protein YhjY with autotransporter beta-barrel domain
MVISYLAACPLAHAQQGDIRTLTTWTKFSLSDMGFGPSFYNGVLSYRGPQSVNVWADGNLNWPSIIKDPYSSPQPRAGTVGGDFVNWLGWTIGFAASSTYSRPELSSGGSASVTGLGGSVYADYSRGVWIGDFRVTLQSTFDEVYINLNRNELLHGALFSNQANVNGWAWTPSLELSYLLTERWFQHGPVVSISTSSTQLNGFSETGSITSRSISAQTTTATIGSVGYAAKFDFLNFQPFASINAHYTLSSTSNLVSSSFTSGPPLITTFDSSGAPELWSFSTQIGTRVFLTPSDTVFAAWARNYEEHFGPTENQAIAGLSHAF